ncbi:MAG: alpha/beta hydrolase [Alphaproteobacteria bacterium]|nr:alpha/beta hydrolase [Alphaproteobacteria bacterium]
MPRQVFGSYTQEQLDAQYDQRSLVPDLEVYFERWREASKRAEDRLTVREAIAYGPDSNETLDVFPAASPGGGLHVHYHGGAWRALCSRDAWFIAEPWVAQGHSFVSVNFGLVPQVSLAAQVDQARRALVWCYENPADLGFESGRITVSGHSSGAYLASMAALVDWGESKKWQPDVQAVIIASGTYDLEPVRLSARNGYLKLTEAEALALSPVRLLKEQVPPCVVVWASQELQEFQRQSMEFAAALRRRGPVRRHAIESGSHFDTWDLIAPDLLSNFAPTSS